MRIGPFVVALAAMASVAAERPARADDAACIAASEEALSLRKGGKLRESLRPLAVCADPACPAEIKAECAQRIGEVKGALPTLTLVVKDRTGNDLTGVKVTLDGAPLAGALDGTPLSLDPGEHVFRFEVAGQPPLEKKLVLRAGEKDRRETVVLGPPPAVPPPAPPPATPPPSSWGTQKTLAVVTGGIGVVGLAVGGVFAWFAASSKSRQTGDCSASACTNYPQAVEDYNTAIKNATGSTVGFVAGGVLAATGVVLFLTAPRPRPPAQPAPAPGAPAAPSGALRLSPLLAGSGGGLSIGGTF